MEEKLPRKLKKQILGNRVNKTKLRKMLDAVVIYKAAKTCYEGPTMNCDPFCPHCGCDAVRCINHYAEYPEMWIEDRCLRCDAVVGYIDNSPYVHALECKEDEYDPTF